MKKLIYSVAVVAAFAFASCGGPSVCDCVKNVTAEKPDESMAKKCAESALEASKDEAKAKAYAEEASKCK